MTNVSKEAVVNLVQVKNIVVGATAVKINSLGMRFVKGVLLRAPGPSDPISNTAPLWIGNATVTADSNVVTGGFPILPGASLEIPSEFLEDLYAISTVADQKLAWVGV
jgi:hypothetical protein